MNTQELPKNTFKEIPQAKPNAQNIVGLTKHSGDVTGYKLSNGQVYSKEQAIEMCRNGEIAGVGIAQRNGVEYLRTIPDADGSNNLDQLPTVTG